MSSFIGWIHAIARDYGGKECGEMSGYPSLADNLVKAFKVNGVLGRQQFNQAVDYATMIQTIKP